MRRAILAIAATVVGLVMLLHYRSVAITPSHQRLATAPTTRPPAAGPAPPGSTSSTRAPSVTVAGATASTTARPVTTTTVPARRTTVTAPPQTAPPTTAPTEQTRQFTGAAAPTQYGNVQVEVTMTGNRITDVTALQMPSDYARSRQISADAGPQLRQEALDAQSANIDTVSGATYTSQGYRQSLQSALDQAN